MSKISKAEFRDGVLGKTQLWIEGVNDEGNDVKDYYLGSFYNDGFEPADVVGEAFDDAMDKLGIERP